jgi:hypothetical protein
MTRLAEIARALADGGASAYTIAEVIDAVETCRAADAVIAVEAPMIAPRPVRNLRKYPVITEQQAKQAEDALAEARRVVGGNGALAIMIGGLTRQAVSQWKRVPALRVAQVERITGIPPERLRPDIFASIEAAE